MTILLLIFSSIVAAISIFQPAGYIKAPALMALVFAAWFAPQLFSAGQISTIPQDAVFDVGMLALFCILAVFFGWWRGVATPIRTPSKRIIINVDALIAPVALLTIFTTVMNIYLNQMRGSEAGQVSQWTGPITIVAFFAGLRTIPLVFSLLMVMHKRTPLTLTLAVANLAVTIPVALIYLRRSEMVDLGIAILGALWFARRIRIAPLYIVAGAVLFAVVVFTIGPLRSAQNTHESQTGQNVSIINPILWKNIDVGKAVATSIDKSPDVQNAVYRTKYLNDYGGFSYGATVWNKFVLSFIPGQILGKDFKVGLLIASSGIAAEDIYYRYNFEYQTGTTSTGVGSAYADFGYLGFFYYLLVGYIMARIYRVAMRGDPWFQTAYLAILPFCLTMITHGHDLFFVNLALVTAVLFALKKISQRKSPPRYSRRRTRLSKASQ
ncbi:hypothetical protein [Sphingorhabdus sp. YGSMI21]|uniref:hypothetical protein n=1 Tax=Sphingorhabdus sp. YGSMI21 TaxID=2077182 RepID=UPI000F5002BB|nr:hypothetical protein [Sphingorhabdus sp. YGSMI21]